MDRRQSLWISLGASVALWLLTLAWSGALWPSLALTFVVVPVCAARYAAVLGPAVGRREVVYWFIVSAIVPLLVPSALALQSPKPEPKLSPELVIAGKPARAYNLGDPTALFRPKPSPLVAADVVMMVVGLFLSMLLYVAIDTLVPGASAGTAACILSGLVFAVLGVWLVHWVDSRKGKDLVVVCPEGCVSVLQGRADVIRWQDVEAVYQEFSDRYVNGMRVDHDRRCTVRLSDGREQLFDQKLRDIELLVAAIHESTAARLVPRMVAEVRAGRTVEFGKLTVGPHGVALKKAVLPWGDVAGVFLKHGYLVIGRRAASGAERVVRSVTAGLAAFVTSVVGTTQPGALGGGAVAWNQVSISDTPNVYALQRLVEIVLEQGAPEVVGALS